jgi:hypothetical protein
VDDQLKRYSQGWAEPMNEYDENQGGGDENEHDQVGTVEVQILLSWFFETSTPTDVSIDVNRAA